MKFRSFISTSLIACAALMATLLPTTASAKQCIWNKGGYVLDVRWYKPADLVLFNSDPTKWGKADWVIARYLTIDDSKPPIQVDRFPVAQGRCNNTGEVLTAVISVIGRYPKPSNCPGCRGTAVDRALVYMNFTHGYSRKLGPPDPGTTWGSSEYLVQRVLNTSEGFLMPNGERITTILNAATMSGQSIAETPLLITTPPTTHYIDFWGTIESPQWGQGGPITP